MVDSKSLVSSTLEASRTSPPLEEIVVAMVLTICVLERTLKALAVEFTMLALKVTLFASMATSFSASLLCIMEASIFTGLLMVVKIPLSYTQVEPSISPPELTMVKSPVPIAVR